MNSWLFTEERIQWQPGKTQTKSSKSSEGFLNAQDSQEESERATKHPEWNPEPSGRAKCRIRVPLRGDWILCRSASRR